MSSALAEAPNQTWSRVLALEPARALKVQRNRGTLLQGAFVSADADRLIIRTKQAEQTIPRATIVRITAKRKKRSVAPWIGMAIGSAASIAMLGDGSDLVASGYAAYVGAGAGIGYLAGWIVKSVRGDELVYQTR